MPYNNYNRNGNYNNNRGYGGPRFGGGYNNNGYGNGYNNGGYDRYEPMPNIPFELGQMVRHRATGTELSVIRIGREQVECRMPDLTSAWFYVHELEPMESTAPQK